MENLLTIFEDIQRSKRSHKSHAKKINNLVTSAKGPLATNYVAQLLDGVLDQTLLFPKNNANLQRILDFYGVLAAVAHDSWQNKILAHLHERSQSTNKTARLRATQILGGFIAVVSQEMIELDAKTVDSFVESLSVRLEDRIPSVRVAAVNALMHLQEPDNAVCDIIRSFLQLMETDDSSLVRHAVTKCVALCETSKTYLVRRVRDVKPEVRVAALSRFIENTDIRQFPKDMRMEIVQAGLNDRDPSVRAATEQLLLRWLGLLQNDVSKFISYFVSMEFEEMANLVAAVLAEKAFTEACENHETLKLLSPKWSSPLSSLSTADLLWVYVKCKFVEQNQSKFALSQFCDRVLPDASRYCQLLSTPYDERSHLHFKYLLLLAPFTNTNSDVSGSKQILMKITEMVLDVEVDCDLLDQLLAAYWQMCVHDRAELNPIEEMMVLVDEIRAQTTEADEDDLVVLNHRAALVVHWMAQHGHYDKRQMSTGVQLIVDCLQQRQSELRVVALSTLSILSVLDADIREQYLPIIKRVALGDFEEPEVRLQALQGLIDLGMVAYAEFTVEDRLEIDSTLAKLMDCPDADLRTVAMEGSVKLIFSGFSKDPHLVSKLLQFFFIGDEDVTINRQRMNQILSVFLQTFLATDDSCLEVVRLSVSLFISELTTAIRDEHIEAGRLASVLKSLFGICERVLETAQELANKSKQNSEQSVFNRMSDAFLYLKETTAACLCRELLKLGSDKIDKKICKEFVRVLGSLSIEWLRESEAEAVKKTLNAIKTSVTMDKPSMKSIDQLLGLVAQGAKIDFNEGIARASFYECAPGLKDLLRLNENEEWDDVSQLEPLLRRSPRKLSHKLVTIDSDDEEEEESSSDEEESASSDDESGEEPEELPPSEGRSKFKNM